MYVYFIKCVNQDGYIKIGKANEPKLRLKELQISCPYKLKIMAKIKFQNETQAYAIEKKIQKIFRKYKIRGEWFEKNIYNDALALCKKYAYKNWKWEHEVIPKDLDNAHLENLRGVYI